MKSRKRKTDVYKNILLTIQNEDSIMEEINRYWQNSWNEVEQARFSSSSRRAFETLRLICKYKNGSIVNRIRMEDGSVIDDHEEVSACLIEALKEIQNSPEFEQYTGNLPFPELPELEADQLESLVSTLSSGKAVSFDLFSDTVLKDEKTVKKLCVVLRDLWSHDISKINGIHEICQSRLVALDKAHPKIPTRNEFRPIIIMSLIVKIMEARWLPKLKDYLIKKLCPAQTGFVPGQGVFTNTYRAVERIKRRTDNKKTVFALFIDFKSAYNHVRHDLLFQRLEKVLDKEEIQFQKAIYDKLTIQSGKASFRPNLGVAQGSIISPSLFNIYTEPLLWEINKLIPIDDIFAYADDILVLCEDRRTLEECIAIIEKWSESNNLKINKKKSAILEFIHRRGKKTQFTVGEQFMGYPVTAQYKYLGTWLNQKLTLDTQLNYITERTEFLRRKLCPSMYHASLDFRKSLWQIFVQPMFEFSLPLLYNEEAATKRAKAGILLRSTFRSFTGLKQKTKSELVDDMLDYDIETRSQEIYEMSMKKWRYRKEGRLFDLGRTKKEGHPLNLCKNQPKSLIKYINMQTAICSLCKKRDIITRCNKDHLEHVHGVKIDDVREIAGMVEANTKCKKNKKEGTSPSLTRKEIMKFADEIIQLNIKKIKTALDL